MLLPAVVSNPLVEKLSFKTKGIPQKMLSFSGTVNALAC